MNEKDLNKMSDKYREIRKAVYEEATNPLSNDLNRHRDNKIKCKQRVEKLCNDADLSNYSGTDERAVAAIWHHLWTKNRYAGIKSQIATTEIRHIKNIFDDYQQFSSPDWNIKVSGHTLIEGGHQVHAFLDKTGVFSNKKTIGNKPKLVKIVSIARLLVEFASNKKPDTPAIDFIKGNCSIEDVWAIHNHLTNIGYRGDLTALHFMMDIGFNVIKPDIVISKLFLDWGWLHKIIPELPENFSFAELQGKKNSGSRFKYTNSTIYKPVINLARMIVEKTSQEELKKDIGWVTHNPIREFDIFLVKYGQQPEREFGIERTLYDIETVNKSCGAKL